MQGHLQAVVDGPTVGGHSAAAEIAATVTDVCRSAWPADSACKGESSQISHMISMKKSANYEVQTPLNSTCMLTCFQAAAFHFS